MDLAGVPAAGVLRDILLLLYEYYRFGIMCMSGQEIGDRSPKYSASDHSNLEVRHVTTACHLPYMLLYICFVAWK
jgi:hypothetical protein